MDDIEKRLQIWADAWSKYNLVLPRADYLALLQELRDKDSIARLGRSDSAVNPGSSMDQDLDH